MRWTGPLLRFVAKHVPFAHEAVSRWVIDGYASSTDARPRPFSLWAPAASAPSEILSYTSWPGLTDRTYSARHLGPADDAYVELLQKRAPDVPATPGDFGRITKLFAREGKLQPGRSSMLFAFFAQWFTDSFLRVDTKDRRKNTSNHDIDLCQIYGLSEAAANLLRSKHGGRLKSQIIDGKEYPVYLLERCEPRSAVIHDAKGGTWRPRLEFEALFSRADFARVFSKLEPDQLEKMYATGTEMGNSSVAYVALSTLFLREHNRICGELQRRNASWDDERLFQTARIINIAMLIQLTLNEYINHITGFPLFRFKTGFADGRPWYRNNWIAIEFDLLYRWHSLVSDTLALAGVSYPIESVRNNNALLEEVGLAAVFEGASCTRAGRIGLRNTPGFLLPAEMIAIKMGRDSRLRSYNAYREKFRLPKLARYDQLSQDAELCRELEAIYGPIDNLEYLVGIFAEQARGETLVGDLMTQMVAYDAFTHIFTNPLLAEQIYNEATFTSYGLEVIENTTLQQLVDRNLGGESVPVSFVPLAGVTALLDPVSRVQADAAQ